MRTIFLLAGLALSTSALAGECAQTTDLGALLGPMGEVEQLLRDGSDATAQAQSMIDSLACLSEVPNKQILARVYRDIGVALVAAGQVDQGSAWFGTALEIDPGFTFGLGDLPEGSPVLGVYEELWMGSAPDPTRTATLELADGTWLLDGNPLSAPEATQGRPHLLQRKGEATTSWVIQGSTFPEEALSVAVAQAEEGKPRKGGRRDKDLEADIVLPDKDCPRGTKMDKLGNCVAKSWEARVMIGGGVAGLLASGVLYQQSTVANKDFQAAEYIEDVNDQRARTNNLYIASAVALGVGSGLTVAGVTFVDGGLGWRW